MVLPEQAFAALHIANAFFMLLNDLKAKGQTLIQRWVTLTGILLIGEKQRYFAIISAAIAATKDRG